MYNIKYYFFFSNPKRKKEGTKGTTLEPSRFTAFLKMGQQMGQKLAALTRSKREVRFKKWDTKMGHN